MVTGIAAIASGSVLLSFGISSAKSFLARVQGHWGALQLCSRNAHTKLSVVSLRNRLCRIARASSN